jgi:hypothetical protein
LHPADSIARLHAYSRHVAVRNKGLKICFGELRTNHSIEARHLPDSVRKKK